MLTDKQRQERRKGIGGSDAAAICGLSKWKTPYKVYLEKVGLDNNEAEELNEFLYFGNVLEPVIAEEYSKRTGYKVQVAENTIIHPDHPWMRANIDRLIVDKNAVLECKTASPYTLKLWGESHTDQLPDEYLLQCAHYAIVTNADFVDLAVLIGGNQFRIYTYNRNENLEKKLIEAEHDFWHKHVLAEVPPEPITSEEAGKFWTVEEDSYLYAENEIKESINRVHYLKSDIKKLEDQKDKLELDLKLTLKDKEGFKDEYGNILVTWKSNEVKRFDLDSFKNTHPDIYGGFIKKTCSRTFRMRNALND